jgi:hypothetical protein
MIRNFNGVVPKNETIRRGKFQPFYSAWNTIGPIGGR